MSGSIRKPVSRSMRIVEPSELTAMRLRAFRCDDPTWLDAQRIAAERGDNVSRLLRDTLNRYVKRHSA